MSTRGAASVLGERPHVIDTLRLTPAECKELLREAREMDARSSDRHDRAHNRFSFSDGQGIVLRVEQPGGGANDYRVIGRNISQGGLAVFHGQLLYPNTRCTVILRTNTGASVSLACVVVYCRHYRARIHEVGLRFGTPVDVNQFVQAESKAESHEQTARAELVSAARDFLAMAQTDAAPEKLKALLQRLTALVDRPQAPPDAEPEPVVQAAADDPIA